MGRNAENVIKAKKQGYKFTSNQLTKWGVKYHKLIFGKPSFDIYVDDKNLGFKKKWIRREIKNENDAIKKIYRH